jgi:hypothetical protein
VVVGLDAHVELDFFDPPAGSWVSELRGVEISFGLVGGLFKKVREGGEKMELGKGGEGAFYS